MSIAQNPSNVLGVPTAKLRRTLTSAFNAAIHPLGVQLVRRSAMEDAYKASPRDVPLPDGARQYLHPQNPRLIELTEAYANHPAARHHLWAGRRLTGIRLDLPYFRDDSVYIWQRRGVETDAQYLVSAEYVQRHDQLGLLERLDEDGLFGAHTFDADGLTVSRDLLDSIIEINFLVRTFGQEAFSAMRLLDIGAGYGRLAHRLMTAFPERQPVLCADAVPTSTLLSEYYLGFRGLGGKTRVVPLHEIEAVMASTRVDLATNIHSFSECTFQSIVWWLDLLRAHEVRHLLIVPNTADRLESIEPNGLRRDFFPALTERGYALVHRTPKYWHSPAAQRCGLFPTNYYLFELRT